jgi:hypothetical protein
MADVFAERFTRTRALQCKADAHLAAGREAIDRWKLAEMTDHSSFGNRAARRPRRPAPLRWDLVAPSSRSPSWQPAWSAGHLVNHSTNAGFVKDWSHVKWERTTHVGGGLDRATSALGISAVPRMFPPRGDDVDGIDPAPEADDAASSDKGSSDEESSDDVDPVLAKRIERLLAVLAELDSGRKGPMTDEYLRDEQDQLLMQGRGEAAGPAAASGSPAAERADDALLAAATELIGGEMPRPRKRGGKQRVWQARPPGGGGRAPTDTRDETVAETAARAELSDGGEGLLNGGTGAGDAVPGELGAAVQVALPKEGGRRRTMRDYVKASRALLGGRELEHSPGTGGGGGAGGGGEAQQQQEHGPRSATAQRRALVSQQLSVSVTPTRPTPGGADARSPPVEAVDSPGSVGAAPLLFFKARDLIS